MHTCESNHSLTKEERLEVYKLAAKFQCPQCDTRLLTAARLKMHIRVRHDRIRDFKCDNCDASYTSGVALRRHLLIHGAEPEFKCVSCAKGFVVENEFLRHLKICSDK